MGYWKNVSIKMSTPRTFKCINCKAAEEALPTSMDDSKGVTHFTYSLPQGWWHINTREGMKLFCGDEAVTIVGGEVLGSGM